MSLAEEVCETDEERAALGLPLEEAFCASNQARFAFFTLECQRLGELVAESRVSDEQAVQILTRYARAARLTGPDATFDFGALVLHDVICAQLYAATGKRVNVAPPPSEPEPEPSEARGTRIALARLNVEVAAVVFAPWGTRFDRFSKAAETVGRLVASGDLERDSARWELLLAADRTGMPYTVAMNLVDAGFAQAEQESAQRSVPAGRADA